MSYAERETSRDSGAPVELYRFARTGRSWAYTSADEPVEHQGIVYAPAVITRSGLTNTQELGRSKLTVVTPRDLAPVRAYVAGAPDGVLALTLLRGHRGDPEVRTIWQGRVLGVSFAGIAAELTAESTVQALQRPGLRARYQVSCRHALYDSGCRLSREAFRERIALQAVDGRRLTAAAFGARPDGYWTAGYVDHNAARRLIVAHAGDTVTLQSALPEAGAGTELDAFPGCDHTIATCRDKFGNALNYGGFPYIPDRSPFGGGESIV